MKREEPLGDRVAVTDNTLAVLCAKVGAAPPALKNPTHSFMGLRIIIDNTLPPDTAEIRNARGTVVRIINLAPDPTP